MQRLPTDQDSPTTVAQGLRDAVDVLNIWLKAAADLNLHVALHTIHHQKIDQRYGIYSVNIEKREPV